MDADDSVLLSYTAEGLQKKIFGTTVDYGNFQKVKSSYTINIYKTYDFRMGEDIL